MHPSHGATGQFSQEYTPGNLKPRAESSTRLRPISSYPFLKDVSFDNDAQVVSESSPTQGLLPLAEAPENLPIPDSNLQSGSGEFQMTRGDSNLSANALPSSYDECLTQQSRPKLRFPDEKPKEARNISFDEMLKTGFSPDNGFYQ